MAVEVGAGYVSVYPDTSSFKSEISKALEGDYSTAGNKGSNSFFEGFLGGALGNVVSNIGGAIFSAISDNLSAGIGRADILSTFPKVMEGFGYSAELASDKIQLIMNRVQGLPTKTQDVVAFTQQIADSTGNLDLAAEGALAFSDALLASGAQTADTQRAQMIFNRVLGSGTATAMQWSSLMSVMPMQLGMVAQDLLGAAASGQDLGAAFRDGTVSIEDILQSMIKLDTEGINGIESFNEQAWNMSRTIENALGLVDTRIQTTIANIIQTIGQENIYNAFMGFADGISAAGGVIVNGIKWLQENFSNEFMVMFQRAHQVGFFLSEIFSGIGAVIGDALKAAAPYIVEFIQGSLTYLRNFLYKLSNAVQAVLPHLQPLVDLIGAGLSGAFGLVGDILGVVGDALLGVLGWISEHGDIVAAALVAIAGGFAAFQAITFLQGLPITLMSVMTSIDSVKNSLFVLWGVISANPLVAVITVIGALVAGLVYWFTQTEEGREAWENLKKKVVEVVDKIKAKWDAFKTAVKKIWDGIVQGIKDFVNNVKKFFTNLTKNIADTWDGIKSKATNVWNAIFGAITGIVGGLVSGVVGVVTGLGSTLGGLWDGMKTTASNVWNGIKSVASNVWGGIKSTIGGLADGIKTTASNAWNSMKTAASNTWSAMSSTASNAWNAMKSSAGSIFGGIQNTLSGIWSKITGNTSSSVSSMQKAINSVQGKSVELKVNTSTVNSAVQAAKKALGSVTSKTVDLKIHTYQTGIKGISVNASYNNNGIHKIATSPIPLKAAKGGYASTATPVIFGEAGAEAIVPFTNQSYMRKLAGAIAEQSPTSKTGGVVVTGNTFVVRNDQDITRVAGELNNMISRQNVGRL